MDADGEPVDGRTLAVAAADRGIGQQQSQDLRKEEKEKKIRRRSDKKRVGMKEKPTRRSWMSMLFSKKSREEETEDVSSLGGESDSYELEVGELVDKERQVAAAATASRSPLVEQFLASHKISWSSSTSSLSSSRSRSSSSSASRSSSALSLGSLIEGVNPSAQGLLAATTTAELKATNPARNNEEAAELRLASWRRQAGNLKRANHQSISNSNSDSSDSELELLHCSGPALAFDCSDDTSCSSVELVWSASRRPASYHQQLDGAARQKCAAAAAHHQQHHQFSVLELAKPARARGRSFGDRRSRRRRRRTSQAKEEEKKKTETPSDKPIQWVANPLFSSSDSVELRSCESLELKDELPAVICDEDEDKEEEEPETTGEPAKTLERDTRKRWSLRAAKSPFSLTGSHQALRHNLSSLKCRLSDTGKRASVLADQLLASIVDTTKELAAHLAVDPPEEGDNQQDASFSLNLEPAAAATTSGKFALIYQHQQQANGRPVITRQPRPAGTSLSSSSAAMAAAAAPVVAAPSGAGSEAIEAAKLGEEPLPQSTATSKEAMKLGGSPGSARRRSWRPTRRRQWRQVESEEEEDFSRDELAKAAIQASTTTMSMNRASRGQTRRLRSLNYWRRFRLRNEAAAAGPLGQMSSASY